MKRDGRDGSEARVVMAHGGGGEMTRRLLERHILPRLQNDLLAPLTDSAVLEPPDGRICMTTDAFVVQPLEFPGGDIGRLAVCGTVNDLAVMGAQPLALSLALVIEEGLPLSLLDRVLDSIAAAADEAGVVVATGDTKVIERRQGDGLIITTAGIGQITKGSALDSCRIRPGDAVFVTGGIAEHGLAVMSVREGLAFTTQLRSDVAPLGGLVSALLDSGADVKFLRDPTRAGVAGVLADLAEETGLSLDVHEDEIPISPTAAHTAALLGVDPLTVANEGKCVGVVSSGDAARLLSACRRHPLGTRGALIGAFTDATPALVELVTHAGGRRVITRPYGEELPRIC